ncbi:Alpha/Beta hydrolase protein [Mycotypha africana]|uniref:Alpha/Beta hydrolase protein n=1 Tax=Mycotypha africana TaxID=64632 RepID=UPI0023013CCF|nr:Alpha/Beta hydrolase protein [Mycotypha africana]KAI8975118.1 Alpha/Beta hydrolase protein [Mycotypha africana]
MIFTGYFWSPNTSDRLNTERILYLETSEKDVDEVYISRASSMNKTQKGSSSVRYPRAGQPNAKSVVNIVEFEVEAATDCHPTGIVIKNIVHKSLSDALEKQFPWVEYIVRLGWFADGQSIWLQLLSRDQKKTVVIKVALSQFSEAAFTVNPTEAEILWEETSSTWINISDAFYFMQQSSNNNSTRFIWSSEKMNGYRHLFLVEKRRDDAIPKIKQLTTGEWCCVDKPLFVDEERSLVYFSAKKHTPLETHFYVIPYDSNHHREVEPVLLTRLGFSHQVTMISPDYFVDCFSTLHDPQVVTVQKIKHDEPTTTPVRIGCSALIMPVVLKKHCCCCNETPPPSPPSYDAHEYCQSNHAYRYHHRRRSSSIRFHTVHGPDPLEAEDAFCTMASSIYRYCRQGDGLEQKLDVDQQRTQQLNGEIFQFTTSDGELLYGCLYKPFCYKPGHSYPTLLHIYGGPQTQLVVNEFRFPRIMRYLMGVYFGFAVVIIDGRGSSDRGMKFESHIKNRLGKVELKDQLEGLQFLHDTMFGASMPPPSSSISPTLEDEQKTAKREKKPVIDLNRVAITGWSYGGYLSLIALAQYPDRFKIAVVGAPVTQWELYDAAYTERYMGLPSENKEAYQESNVLTYIERFPSQEHRLLLAHGLIDENVHFTNTELLVSQLVKHKKPHYLQVYPTEKHGIRHASVNEHFETLMFYWLVNYL